MKWSGVSGVPGLGVSVTSDHVNTRHHDTAQVLRLWDEAETLTSDDIKHSDKLSLGDKIVSLFKLKRRNTVKAVTTDQHKPSPAHISVKRSQSMVTMRKNKLGTCIKINLIRLKL